MNPIYPLIHVFMVSFFIIILNTIEYRLGYIKRAEKFIPMWLSSSLLICQPIMTVLVLKYGLEISWVHTIILFPFIYISLAFVLPYGGLFVKLIYSIFYLPFISTCYSQILTITNMPYLLPFVITVLATHIFICVASMPSKDERIESKIGLD